MDQENVWIYHERQQAALCGQHALNNLCQANLFSSDYLASIAHELDLLELQIYGPPGSQSYLARLREGSSNVDSTGNFSIQVLRQALQNRLNLELPNIVDETIKHLEPTNFDGFICHKSSHWFAIRKINGHFWNLNSFLPKPETISHFKLAAEIAALQKHDYNVFVAVPNENLPEICRRDSERVRGKMKYWWKESILLKSQSRNKTGGINYTSTANFTYEDTSKLEVEDSANATQDPWLNAGSGHKLGNISSTKNKPRKNAAENKSEKELEAMTEEEMLQHAIEQSLSTENDNKDDTDGFNENVNYEGITVLPEPDQNAKGEVIKVQLKLPHNKKVVRKFLATDEVQYLYAVVAKLCEDGIVPSDKTLQLSAGFPPTILNDGHKSLGDCKLNNAAVTCRWI